MKNDQKKVLIFDAVCGLTSGHNLPTINKYAYWLKQELNYNSEAFVATTDVKSREYLEFKILPWVYGYWLYENLTLSEEIKAKNRVIKNDSIADILKNSLHHIWAYKNIERSFAQAVTENHDFIFFPGADFYSLLSVLSAAKKKKIPSGTIVILRLMGVMEWATKLPRAQEIFKKVIFDIKKILGENVRFTAETEKYALELSSILNSKVIVTSIPSEILSLDEKIVKNKNTINIACLGGARADKGYFDILKLSQKVLDSNHSRKNEIRFIVQSMNPRSLDYDWDYQRELSKIPNVTLIKQRLSDDELDQEIQRADIILLPYSEGTYASRGSAILFDTLPHGKVLLGAGGTGFGDTIMHAGLGFVYYGSDDFLNRLFEIIGLDIDQIKCIQINQENYSNKMLNNLKECFR